MFKTTKLVLVGLVLLISLFIIQTVSGDGGPGWSYWYRIEGVERFPSSDLEKPFTAWLQYDQNRSRIDYYNGMVKTYQLMKGYGEFGADFKVFPMTSSSSDTTNIVRACFQWNGTKEKPTVIRNLLPALQQYQLVSTTERVNGHQTEKWTYTSGNSKNTMWLYYVPNPYDPSVKDTIPVRYEQITTYHGNQIRHSIIDYFTFDYGPIDEFIFHVEYTEKPCKVLLSSYTSDSFDAFKRQYNKVYVDGREDEMRKTEFEKNVHLINEKNRANLGYTLTVNHLADRTEEELDFLFGRKSSSHDVSGGGLPFNYYNYPQQVPDTFDWRIYGAVTPVKDQSNCGSCWSFGVTGTIEGAYFLKNNALVSLSEQALIDCSWSDINNGCEGGLETSSYTWIMKHSKGIPTRDSYGPYLGLEGACHLNDSMGVVVQLSGYVNVPPDNENALKLALVNNGPISIGIDASAKEFLFYSNGVLHDIQCGNTKEQLNHAVLLVGYGTLNDINYWLVKNSWTNYWGNDGYVMLAIENNTCGVMTDASYVILAAD